MLVLSSADLPLLLQLKVKAQDKSATPQSSTAEIRINIQRNEYAPEFVQKSYSITDDKGVLPGVTLLTVSAVDKDINNPLNAQVSSCHFQIVFGLCLSIVMYVWTFLYCKVMAINLERCVTIKFQQIRVR